MDHLLSMELIFIEKYRFADLDKKQNQQVETYLQRVILLSFERSLDFSKIIVIVL